MATPSSVEELNCMLTRLINAGSFDSSGDRATFHQARQEFIRTIGIAHHVDPVISACERLVGALFIRAIEQTNFGVVVTIKEAQK